MSTLSEASTFAQQWADKQRGIIALAEFLAGITSIDQATGEYEARSAEAKRQHDAALVDLSATQAKLEDAVARNADTAKSHESRLAETLASASRDAPRPAAAPDRRRNRPDRCCSGPAGAGRRGSPRRTDPHPGRTSAAS